MAISFTGTTTSIMWENCFTDSGLSVFTRSVSIWVNLSSLANNGGAGGNIYLFDIETKNSLTAGFGGTSLFLSSLGIVTFALVGTDSAPLARGGFLQKSSTSAVSTGSWFHIVGTKTSSGVGSIYINGALISSSASATSTATALSTGNNGNLSVAVNNYLAGSTLGNNISNGVIGGVSYHNVTLTDAEVAEAYAKRAAIATTRGLVFSPNLWARGEVGEGNALTSTCSFVDVVTGLSGLPTGSPTYKQDTILTF